MKKRIPTMVEAIRSFAAAYFARTGKELTQFWMSTDAFEALRGEIVAADGKTHIAETDNLELDGIRLCVAGEALARAIQ